MTAESFGENIGFSEANWIMAWGGLISDIPEGWAICDGNNGTPDLRDRFVRGASSSSNNGTLGGNHSQSVSAAQMPSHSHTGSLNSTGSHSHGVVDGDGGAGGDDNTTDSTPHRNGTAKSLSGGNQNHTHGGNTNYAGSSNSYDNRPQFKEVVFIKPIL